MVAERCLPQKSQHPLFVGVRLQASFASMCVYKIKVSARNRHRGAALTHTGCFFSHFSFHPPSREIESEDFLEVVQHLSIHLRGICLRSEEKILSFILSRAIPHQYDIQIKMTIENVSACVFYSVRWWCDVWRLLYSFLMHHASHRLLFLFKINTHPFNFILALALET